MATPLTPLSPKLAEILREQAHANPSFISQMMNADFPIKASLIFGHAFVKPTHMTPQQLHQAMQAARDKLEEQTRREIRSKESMRGWYVMHTATTVFCCCIAVAFLMLFYKPWLFNVIFIPSVLSFTGFGVWYTRRNYKLMLARHIHEDIKRRVGVK